MAIFTQPTSTPAQQAAAQIKQVACNSFRQLASSGQQGWNLLWKNRLATPQDILAALGTDAAAIFQLAQLNLATVATAAGIGGTDVPIIPPVPAGYSLATNADGSMTITATPAPAPAPAPAPTPTT